jgi:hypothetical protein
LAPGGDVVQVAGQGLTGAVGQRASLLRQAGQDRDW